MRTKGDIMAKEYTNPLNIMTDKGPWIFTEDLIHRIKQREMTAITEFYNSNYDVLLRMAKKFVYTQKHFMNTYIYDVDDCIQQVFIDLPYYDYSSRIGLYMCIVKGSFLMSN
ncbi:hypothetical protein EOM82_08355, partial [bacterium]|nr:hypothetical protein [bacterium]